MTKLFFDHIIRADEVMVDLSEHLSILEQEEIHGLVLETLRYEAFDVIFESLPATEHEFFMSSVDANPEDIAHLHFLERHVPNIRDLLETRSSEVKARLLDSIRSV